MKADSVLIKRGTHTENIKEFMLTSCQLDIWRFFNGSNKIKLSNLGARSSIEGVIHYDVLNQAINRVIQENDALRIYCIDKNGTPFLAFRRDLLFSMPYFDFSHKDHPHDFALKWMEQEMDTPFDLKKPLVDCFLIKTGENLHILFLKMHHIISDNYAILLTLKRIVRYYNSPEIPWDDLRNGHLSFKRSIEKDQVYLNSKRYKKDIAFWKTHLRKIPASLLYHTEKKDPSSLQLKEISFTLSVDTHERIVQFSKDLKISEYHFFIAVFVLSYLMVFNKKEMVIGIPVVNRDKAEKKIIGRCLNLIPFHIHTKGFSTFHEMIRTIHADLMKCYRHARLSYGKIHEIVMKKGRESNVLCDVILSYETMTADHFFSGTDTQTTCFVNGKGIHPFLISIFHKEKDQKFSLHLQYMTHPMSGNLTLEKLQAVFEAKVEDFLGCPHKPLGEKSALISQKVSQNDPLLSFSQAGVFFLNSAHERDRSVNFLRLRITGVLDYDMLEKSIVKVIQRHEILRTNVRIKEAFPYQHIHDSVSFHLKRVDLKEYSDEISIDHITGMMFLKKKGDFDLKTDLLLDATLYELDKKNHILNVMMHRFISDKTSLLIFVREVMAYYQSMLENNPDLFSEPPLQYQNYSLWERERHLDNETQKKYEGLKQKLSLLSPVTFLEKDPSTRGKDKGYASYRISFDPHLFNELNQFCDENDSLISMVFLTIINSLIHKYTGETRICIGTISQKRDLPGLKGLMGPLDSVLPFFFEWDRKDPSFEDLLVRTKAHYIKGDEFLHYSFEKLNDSMAPEALGVTFYPFDIMMIFEDENKAIVPDMPFQYRIEKESLYEFKDSLTFHFQQFKDTLSLRIEYPNHRYLKSTVERVFIHFSMLLKAMLKDKKEKISNCDIVTLKEVHHLRFRWNQPGTFFPKKTCIHEYIEAIAREHPDHPALIHRDQTISYEKLNQKANHLARILMKHPASMDAPLGIYLPVSENMVIAMLGVLKSGGAFVPLDGLGLGHEFDEILKVSEIQLIMTERKYAPLINRGDQILIYMDDISFDDVTLKLNGENTSRGKRVTLQHLACLKFTPKPNNPPLAVMISHENIIHYIFGAKKRYFKEMRCTLPIYSALSNSHSMFSVLIPLVTGGSVALYPDAGIKEVVEDDRVDLILSDISHFNQLIINKFSTSRLSQLIVFGSSIPANLMHKISEQFSNDIHIFIEYETPEVAGGVMRYYFDAEIQVDEQIPLGHPTENNEVYLLDSYQNLVPQGAIGEIYLSGKCLTVGFFKRPDMTRKRFVIRTFSNRVSSVMLKTGVYGRYLSDGTLIMVKKVHHMSALQFDNCHKKQESISQTSRTKMSTCLGDLSHHRDFMIHRKDMDKFQDTENQTENTLTKNVEDMVDITKISEDKKSFEWDEGSILTIQMIALASEIFGIAIALKTLLGKKIIDLTSPKPGGPLLNVSHPPKEKTAIKNHKKKVPSSNDIHPEMTIPATEYMGDSSILSFSQHFLWSLNQFEKHDSFYHIPKAIHLIGDLSCEDLEKAIIELVHRHEILQSQFIKKEGGVRQETQIETPFKLYIRDFSHFSKKNAEKRVIEIINREAKKAFNLTYDCLLRMTIYRIAEKEHILFLNIHRIIADERSLHIFFSEISDLYRAMIHHQPSPLKPLKIQYRDYALFQRTCFENHSFENHRKYWQENLKGLTFLNLPTDDTRVLKESFEGETLYFSWDQEITQKLHDFTEKSDVTLFMVLLSVFKLLLYKYSGQRDICVGTFLNDRKIADTQKLIGSFSTPLALRSDLHNDLTFMDLLTLVKQTTLKAIEYEQFPFEKIVEMIIPDQKLSHTPLFQVVFTLDSSPKMPSNILGLSSSNIPIHTKRVVFDLMLNFKETDQGLKGCIEFKKDLYQKETILRLSEHLKVLTHNILEQPEKKCADFDMLSDRERNIIINEWNDTDVSYLKSLCIHRMFEETARQKGREIAIEYRKERITYSALNKKVNRLAHYLHKRGVSPKMSVGICFERSIDMIKGVLAIVKAGGVYVHIDPSFSRERISFILEDSKVSVILTRRSMRRMLPKNRSQVICLEDKAHLIDKEPESNPKNPITLNDPVYITYAVGPAGTLLGVPMTHRSLYNFLHWQRLQLIASKSQRVLQYTSLNDNISFQEIFSTLSTGLTLVLAKDESLKEMDKLAELIYTQKIHRLFLPTRHLHYLSDQMINADLIPESLKEIIVNGERLKITPIISELFRQIPECQCINQYGLRECHVVASYTLSGEGQDFPFDPPIGRPINNTKFYIVDQHLNPQPIGIPGELLIGGMSLTGGYVNNAELTKERFIKDPFSPNPNALLFRTGDRVRYLSGGNIHFIGHNESLVKIGNMHIELLEIEAVINEIYGIKESVVTVKKDKTGMRRIIAYMIFEDMSLKKETIIGEMAKILPEYMIPSVFMRMERFPLSSENKVDKNALPNPSGF